METKIKHEKLDLCSIVGDKLLENLRTVLFQSELSINLFEQIKDYDEMQRENFKEMDNLYRENVKFKSRTDQLERENKQLEQGLKEVIENLKTYTPGR